MHARLLAVAILLMSGARGPKPAAIPSAGEKAPALSLPDPAGGTFRLADFAGKKSVVVVFYPKAFSGG